MSVASTAERLLVLGVGNPILGDDGVGWRVAEAVGRRLADRRATSTGPAAPGEAPAGEPRIEVDCLAVGGLALMERLVGYDRVILVDAVHGSGDPPGAVRVRGIDEIPGREATHLDSPHDVPIRVALETGRALGAKLPATITVVSVEAVRVDTFGDELTPAVGAALAAAVALVEGLLPATA